MLRHLPFRKFLWIYSEWKFHNLLIFIFLWRLILVYASLFTSVDHLFSPDSRCSFIDISFTRKILSFFLTNASTINSILKPLPPECNPMILEHSILSQCFHLFISNSLRIVGSSNGDSSLWPSNSLASISFFPRTMFAFQLISLRTNFLSNKHPALNTRQP